MLPSLSSMHVVIAIPLCDPSISDLCVYLVTLVSSIQLLNKITFVVITFFLALSHSLRISASFCLYINSLCFSRRFSSIRSSISLVIHLGLALMDSTGTTCTFAAISILLNFVHGVSISSGLTMSWIHAHTC